MNPSDPTVLPLRDIHLPAAVSWWPPAPGWWVAIVLLLAALAGLAWWAWRWRRLRVRRVAMGELARIRARYAAEQDAHACASDLSRLLRRICLHWGAAPARAVTGEDYLRALAGLGLELESAESETLLLRAPYSPPAADALDPASVHAFFERTEAWIGTLPASVRASRHA